MQGLFYSRNNALDSATVSEFMFPDSEYPVISFSQLSDDLAPSEHIRSNLSTPVARVALGERTKTARAMVPETAINKYGKPLSRKQEIRPTLDAGMEHPPRKPPANKAIPQSPFGGTVTASPYLAHEYAALFTAEDIHAPPRVAQDTVLNRDFRGIRTLSLVLFGGVRCQS